jgi:hypothetical protein
MAHEIYPTLLDLTTLLSGGSTTVAASDLLASALEASIEGFEEDCGIHFLAGRDTGNQPVVAAERIFFNESVCYYPGGGAILNLGPKGELARIDSVVYETAPGTDTALVLNDDYRGWPENAPVMTPVRPYTSIRIWPKNPVAIGGWPQWQAQVKVTGLWGYATYLPSDVWLAMLHGAALTHLFGNWAAVTAAVRSSLPVKAWTSPGGVSTTYNTDWLSQAGGVWMSTVGGALARYRELGF